MIPWHTAHSLGQLIEDGELDEIEYENARFRIRLNKSAPSAAPAAAPPDTTSSGETGEATAPSGGDEDNRVAIQSPMVGTFYKAPAPDADPFVEVGDEVTEGQTVCIIEAMKLMNEIESEIDGVIREVCRDDAEPVSKGDDLFYIEPTG